MLVPKFTIRWLLAITTVCAVISLIATFAIRGQAWAIAVSVTLAAFVAGFGAYLCFFVVAQVFSVISTPFVPKRPSSPFAHDQPPPQVIPPDGPI